MTAREQVAAVLRAVSVHGASRYAWLGARSRPLPAKLRDELDAHTWLRNSLREELYWSFYCRGGVTPARWNEPGPPSLDPALVAAVEAASACRGRFTAAHRRVRAAGPATAGVLGISPGFLTVIGDAGDEPDGAVVRVYWNVTAPGAPELVAALTQLRVPFRLKVADHPARFDRADAGVLYLRASDFVALREPLTALALTLAHRLRPWEPVFTLRLAPGVGLAEDASTGESFGERRCALLADGLLAAHGRRPGQRPAIVEAAFTAAGVSLDAPYREPGLEHVLP